MGKDSVQPFLEYPGKWVILLGLTSNPGAEDFQFLELKNSTRLYEDIILKASGWGSPDNIMFVAGARRTELLSGIRKILPDHFLLVPGVGAQGGNLEDVAREGMNSKCGLIVNSSRAVLYADDSADFAVTAREKAMELQKSMSVLMDRL
jgi:orotidine-5'-phosphate decarboxylase